MKRYWTPGTPAYLANSKGERIGVVGVVTGGIDVCEVRAVTPVRELVDGVRWAEGDRFAVETDHLLEIVK